MTSEELKKAWPWFGKDRGQALFLIGIATALRNTGVTALGKDFLKEVEKAAGVTNCYTGV